MSFPLCRPHVCVLLMLLGCDGVGRSVVGRQKFDRPPVLPVCLRKRPECLPLEPVRVYSDGAPRDPGLPPCTLPSDTRSTQNDLTLFGCELSGEALDTLHELVGAELRNVRIALGSGHQLSLRECELRHVAVVAAESDKESPRGQLFISHSTLWGSDLTVERLQLLSSTVQSCSLRARQLSADDVQLIDSEVSAESATMAAVDMRASRLSDCSAGVLIAASTIKRSRLACEGRLQIYVSPVDLSSVDGELELQETILADGNIGLEHPTRITGWSAGLDNEILCAAAESVHSSGGSLNCLSCEGAFSEGKGDVCMDAANAVEVENSFCASFDTVPKCESFPQARRPFYEP